MNSALIADPHQRKLLKKWSAILESGKKIQSESTKIALAQVLENTRNYFIRNGMLNEAADVKGNGVSQTVPVGFKTNGVLRGADSYPYTGYPNQNGYGDFYLPNVVMPMLRRVMPDLIANDLVAVQPLNAPTGYALAYRPIYNKNGTIGDFQLTSDAEIGYAPTDTRYSGAVDKDLTASVAVSADYWDAYAGKQNGAWTGAGAPLGPASEFASLYDGTYPTVSFGLVKACVEAKTRKLAAHWSPELAEDMQAMHGIDVEREMVNTLTYEVGAEIDRQIITEMVKAAIVGGSTSTWTPLSADGLDQMGRLATLLTQITVEAQQIAIRTRRGHANFVVTTPRICGLLQQMSMNKYTSFKTTSEIPTTPDTGVGALSKIGYINDDSQLLVRDSYAAQGSADYVLLGYKGKQAGDSGIIYMPYIPLQLSKVMQPGTFTPSVGARTRYGLLSNPWDAKNFYCFMRITDVSKPYYWSSERQFIGDTSKIPLPTQKDNPYAQTVFPQVNQ